MNIKAIYDQTITKAIRNDDGDVIAHEPTTHHYTFGSVGSELSGGFYLKAGDELPKRIKLTTEPQIITAKVPALEIEISVERNCKTQQCQRLFSSFDTLRTTPGTN